MSNSTTHLKKQHPEEFEKYKYYLATHKTPLPSIGRKKWSCTFSQEVWEADVTAYILDTMAPLSIVENKYFRKIFDDLSIKKNGITVDHMSRPTLLTRINRFVEEQMKEIKIVVQKTQYFCTTADAWSGKKRRFLGVTLHWIDEKTFARKSAAIACKRFPGTHSYDAIARTLTVIHGSFNLDGSKLVATVTDNGSNFVKAFKTFGVSEADNNLLDTLRQHSG